MFLFVFLNMDVIDVYIQILLLLSIEVLVFVLFDDVQVLVLEIIGVVVFDVIFEIVIILVFVVGDVLIMLLFVVVDVEFVENLLMFLKIMDGFDLIMDSVIEVLINESKGLFDIIVSDIFVVLVN